MMYAQTPQQKVNKNLLHDLVLLENQKIKQQIAFYLKLSLFYLMHCQ